MWDKIALINNCNDGEPLRPLGYVPYVTGLHNAVEHETNKQTMSQNDFLCEYGGNFEFSVSFERWPTKM